MKHLLLILTLLLVVCHQTPQAPQPGIVDLTPLSGMRFVAYISPDRSEKPDTIRLSFVYSGIAADRITAKATIDSGASWFVLPTPVFTDNGKGTVEWVPFLDTIRFDYFGTKSCLLRLEAEEMSRTVESDTFSIIGPVPLRAISPTAGDTFDLNDSISINYQVNSDRISNIRTFFMTQEMVDWKEIAGSTTRREDAAAPLKSFTTRFLPAAYDTLFTNHPGTSVRFLLKDYFSPLPNGSIELHGIVIQ